MARPKSEDKRSAIVAAAIQVFSERGLSAATAAVSKAAGVAEGTLFTYFKTKDDLVNAIYLEIKRGMAEAMISQLPGKKSVRDRLKHVWDHYVDWGVANPPQQKVLRQIEIWSGLTEESKVAGSAPFAKIQAIANEAAAQSVPQRFLAAAMSALAETTMQFMQEDPKRAKLYRDTGFAMLWAGMARKS